MKCLRRRLECQGGRPEIEVRVTADQWILHNGNESQDLQAHRRRHWPDAQRHPGRIGVPASGTGPSQPVRMRIVRNRQVSPPANGFDLKTGPGSIPCRLLATFRKEFGVLGPNCRFTGHFSANDTPEGWSGDLSGQLIGVDLRGLARQNTAAAITGTADITIRNATFQRGRIDELTGRIVSGPGAMGGGLLAALVTQLRLRPSPQLGVTSQSLAFDRLGLDFWIDNRRRQHCRPLPGRAGRGGGRRRPSRLGRTGCAAATRRCLGSGAAARLRGWASSPYAESQYRQGELRGQNLSGLDPRFLRHSPTICFSFPATAL